MFETRNLLIILLILLLIIISILIGDIYILNLQVSNLLDILNDQSLKIEKLEKAILIETSKTDLNQIPIKMIFGTVLVSCLVVMIMYFSGIDSTSIVNTMNVSSNQLVELVNNQIKTESHHFNTLINHEKLLTQNLLEHLNTCFNLLESKIKVLGSNLLNSTANKDYNSILSYDNNNKPPVWK